MKRRIVIQFIVTAQEKREIRRAAKVCEESLSEFIRRQVMRNAKDAIAMHKDAKDWEAMDRKLSRARARVAS